MPYLLYILHSSSHDKFYIGHTGDDMAGRLRRHLSDHKGITAITKDWKIVYTEEHSTKEDAYRRELTIKKLEKQKDDQETY